MSKVILSLAFIALATDYFERHPNSEECHITSDERVFHTPGAAEGFAFALKNKDVVKITRADLETAAEAPADETPADETPMGEPKVLELTLENFNPETADYIPAKELAEKLELKLVSNKKVDVFAALTAAQEAAKTNQNQTA